MKHLRRRKRNFEKLRNCTLLVWGAKKVLARRNYKIDRKHWSWLVIGSTVSKYSNEYIVCNLKSEYDQQAEEKDIITIKISLQKEEEVRSGGRS